MHYQDFEQTWNKVFPAHPMKPEMILDNFTDTDFFLKFMPGDLIPKCDDLLLLMLFVNL